MKQNQEGSVQADVPQWSAIWVAMAMLWAVLLALPAFAQEFGNGNEPIEITADQLDVMQDQQKAIFSGNVLAKQGVTKLAAQKMVVYYRTGEQAKGSAQRISRIDVLGNVKIANASENASGQKGVYYVDKKLVRLVGNVVLSRGQNVIKGDALEYNMATGRSKVLSRAAIGQAGGSGSSSSGGRVKGVFLPGGE